ncbi:MAG: hypothetical protein PHH04_01500 [Thomasclavelia sp.]|nr:hypothetical protein [Thomasclavelia sp.]
MENKKIHITKFKVLAVILWLIIFAGSVYLTYPTFNITSAISYGFIITSIVLFVGLFVGGKFLSGERNVDYNLVKLVGKIVAIVIVLALILTVVNCPIFSASQYASRISVKEGTSKDIPAVDYNKLAVIDRDSTKALGDKVMGQMEDLVSQFDVSSEYTEISYKDSIYRVTPLTYASFFKWNNNHNDGIPGYIMVNSTTGKAQIVRLKDLGLGNMKYVPSAYFNENLYRHLQLNNPTTLFGDPSFEIDEKGYPYYVSSTYTYSPVGMRKRVTGAIILDPITGDYKQYKLKDIPKWVDRVYPSDLVIEELNSYGKYQKGFINSKIGQSGVIQCSSGYNYLVKDGDIYLYTGITSTNSDSSNLGFMLVNLRTHKAIRIKSSGADEKSAMKSAEGKVKNYGYDASFPILVNVDNKPVYFMGLKDNSNITKMYAMVSAEDYQKVVTISVDDDKNDLLNSMKSLLDTGSDTKSKKEKATITVTNVHYMTFNEKNYLFFNDTEGNGYKYVIENTSDKALYLQNNQSINIEYSGSDVRTVSKITINK